jgi:hypothetical protein
MKTSFPRVNQGAFPTLLVLLFVILSATDSALAGVNKRPTLISQQSSTRAVAFESVTMKAEPFSPTATVAFSSDTRTRLCIFAMDLELLPGEGLNAFTADVQDASGKLYPLRIEFMGAVPNFPGITMFVVRLADDLGDVGDVLLRLNLHGVGSNRVRVAIGHSGGGPADDTGAVATPAPQTPPPADTPLDPNSLLGTPSDADAVRFLEQISTDFVGTNSSRNRKGEVDGLQSLPRRTVRFAATQCRKRL